MDNKTFGQTVHDQLRRINMRLAGIMREVHLPANITISQGMVLMTLHGAGKPMSVAELGDMVHTPRSNVSNICNRLESVGYVRRERQENDRRVVKMALTAEGEAFADRFERGKEEFSQKLAGGISEEQQRQILDGLTILGDALDRCAEWSTNAHTTKEQEKLGTEEQE